MLNNELAASKWIASVSTAHSKCSIAFGRLPAEMYHAPVALDVTAAASVPDTEGVQVSAGTLT